MDKFYGLPNFLVNAHAGYILEALPMTELCTHGLAHRPEVLKSKAHCMDKILELTTTVDRAPPHRTKTKACGYQVS